MCDLDIAQFGLASQFFLDNVYADPAGVLNFVNFFTIRNRQNAAGSYRICQNAPDLVKNATLFVSDNIPAETNEGIIQGALRAANAISGSCFIRIDLPDHAALKLSGQLISGVMGYPDFAARVLVCNDEKRRLFDALKAWEPISWSAACVQKASCFKFESCRFDIFRFPHESAPVRRRENLPVENLRWPIVVVAP